MPAACRSSCRSSSSASWSIAACRRPAAKAGGRSRAPPRRIRPSPSTTPRRAASSRPAPSSACCTASRSSAARARSPVAREQHGERHRAARLARRLCRPLRRRPSARADAGAPTASGSTARTLFVPAEGRQPSPAGRDQFAVRFHLHPVGQGEPAGRRPRRHADAAEQGGVDLQRLRGPRRASRRASTSPATTARAAPCRS